MGGSSRWGGENFPNVPCYYPGPSLNGCRRSSKESREATEDRAMPVLTCAQDACRRQIEGIAAYTIADNDGDFQICSTPVGVIEGIARRSVRWSCSQDCAQRLSASSKDSPFDSPGVAQPYWFVLNACRRHRRNRPVRTNGAGGAVVCSTPVGVIEGIAPNPSAVGRAYPGVLNACRRHRRNRDNTIPRSFADNTVLNACRRHRRNRRAMSAASSGSNCAQRLSASSKESPCERQR